MSLPGGYLFETEQLLRKWHMAYWCNVICVVGVVVLVQLLPVDTVQAQDKSTTLAKSEAPISPKVGDSIGDWVFNCRALSAAQTECLLSQTIVEQKSKKPVLHLAIRKLGKEQKPALIVNVPLGVYLAAGIGGKVDEGKQFSFVWQSCGKQGCQAALGLDDALKKAMRSGKQLLIGFKARPDSDTFTVAASLKGVTAGFKALSIE